MQETALRERIISEVSPFQGLNYMQVRFLGSFLIREVSSFKGCP